MKFKILFLWFITAVLCGCTPVVDITKTAKGFYPPTNANDIEILKSKPDRKYIELGTLTVSRIRLRDVAKMHNAIRTKAAPLGANAVIITNEGVNTGPLFVSLLWATGVAIRYD